MYSESASLEFLDSVQQSDRLAFLAELAGALEAAVGLETNNPGFSIDVRANGKVDVLIWQAWKRRALWSQVQAGHGRGLFRVVRPKEFAEFGQSDKNVDGDV